MIEVCWWTRGRANEGHGRKWLWTFLLYPPGILARTVEGGPPYDFLRTVSKRESAFFAIPARAEGFRCRLNVE